MSITLFPRPDRDFSSCRVRADVVAKHKRGIYIFELKVDEPVDKAFRQIREKNYAAPYLADGRPIWLIGLSFDSKTRHLVDFAAVTYGDADTKQGAG